MDEDRLDSLLLAWQEQRQQGHDLTANDLCRDCPELTAVLGQRIAELRRMQSDDVSIHLGAADALLAAETPKWQASLANPGAPDTLKTSDQPSPAASPQRDLVPGYEILRELGRGGMGVVYQARQQSLNRLVALKMILAGRHADTESLTRFLREAETIGRLRHPNVVQVYDYGSHDGKPYFSLEYLEGGSLVSKLKGEPQAPAQAARLVLLLAEAVQAAHEQGIVHRDLKPANVLLASDGTPKITDFGVAKQGDSGMTATGDVLGTPSYMAPEQAEGKAKDVGPAADIYSLGSILYELVTGRPPFKGESVWDTIQMVVDAEPVAPCQLQPRLPRDLETICLKCLQKEPQKRYASARALATDLQHFLSGEPIAARPIGYSERFWRWCRRKPAVASLLAGLALVLMSGFAGVTWFWLRAEHHRQEAVDNLQEANRQRDQAVRGFRTAREAVDRFYTAVSQDELLNAPGMSTLRKKLLQDARAYYQSFVQEHAEDVQLRLELAHAMQRLGDISKEVVSDTEAMQVYQEAVAAYRNLLQAGPADASIRRDLAACWGQIGLLHRRAGRSNEAEKAFQEEAQLWDELAKQYPGDAEYKSGLAVTYNHLGLIYRRSDRLPQAESILLRGVTLWKELLADDKGNAEYESFYSWCLLHLGYVYDVQDQTAKAEAAFLQMLALRRGLVERHPTNVEHRKELAGGYQVLATFYEDREPTKAERFYRDAISTDEKLVRENPRVVSLMIRQGEDYAAFGSFLSAQEKRSDALPWANRSIKTLEEVLTLEPAHVQAKRTLREAYVQRADLLDDMGRSLDAVADWDRAIQLDGDHPRAPYRISRAVCLAHAGALDKAIAVADAIRGEKELNGLVLYNCACVYAIAARALKQDPQPAERHAVHAMELLAQARTAGYFKSATNQKLLRTDKDLESLRSRADFKKLVDGVESGGKPTTR
jgi:tetratricopeptide (TPR) repeat protein/tRNA A-37 threonylcarbamoyl transferase component Bud32